MMNLLPKEYYELMYNNLLKEINVLNRDPIANAEELNHLRERKKALAEKIENM